MAFPQGMAMWLRIDAVHPDDVDENLMHIIHIRREKREWFLDQSYFCRFYFNDVCYCGITIYMAIFSSAIEEKTVWPFWVELWVILLLLDAVHVRAQMICICRYMRMMRIGKYRHMAIPSYQVSGWHKLLEPENLVLRIFLPSIFEMFWGLKGWQWGLLVHSFHSPQSSILTPESWILNPQSWILSPQS